MKADLRSARAKLSWANVQIPVLGAQIQHFLNQQYYQIPPPPNPNDPIRIYRFHAPPIPDDVRTAAGMIIQAQRDSLDHMMVALAIKNGATNTRDIHFPFAGSASRYGDPSTQKKLTKLSAGDRAVIDALQPYKGGDDELFSLNHLCNRSKHRDMIPTAHRPTGLQMQDSPRRFTVFDPESSEDGKTIVVRVDADPGFDFQLSFEASFRELNQGAKPAAVIQTLQTYSQLASSIIDRFE